MNALLEHTWGVSRAADRVWSHVTGIAPRRAVLRPLMVLQAFFDESEKDDVFILAGHIASAETWAKFSHAWEELLPHGYLDEEGRRHFHLSDMMKSPERIDRVPAFAHLLSEHKLLSVSLKLKISDIENARSRIYIPDKELDWGLFSNNYIVAFRCLMDAFHEHRDQLHPIVGPDDVVDFIFDDRQKEKKIILSFWDGYVDARSEAATKLYGSAPRFENDKVFLPLQAADLSAGLVRQWYEAGKPDAMKWGSSGQWTINMPAGINIEFDENSIVSGLVSVLRHGQENLTICDRGVLPEQFS